MANSDKNIRITTSRNKATFPNIVFTGSAAGSSVITLNILDDNTMSFESNEGQVFSLDSNLTSGTIWGVSDVSGIPLLRASAGATIGIAEYAGSLVGIGTNIPTYKLHVRGLAAFASTADQTLSFIVDTSLAAGSANFQVRRGNSIRFYSSGDSFYTAFVSSATGNTVYTLPPTSPQSASGTSVLSSTIAGVMSWVPMTSGGGSGSVNSGTAGSVAFYAADGTAVSGTADIYISSGNGVTINPTTNSTSTTTGALVVKGGAGIAGTITVGQRLTVGSSLNASSTSTGALVNSGGLGLAGNAFIGGTVTMTDTTNSTSSSTGSLVLTGGVGVGGTVSIGQRLTVGSTLNSTSTTTGALVNSGGLGLAGNAFIGGTVTMTDTTNSTSSTTGSLVLSGGVGIGGTVSIGQRLTVGSTLNSTSTTTGAEVNSGGLGLAGNAFIGGTVTMTNTTNSTSSTTGSLVVSGGAGIALSASIGGRLQLFNGANYSAFVSSATGNTVYTLPPTSPQSAVGTSVLASSIDGTMRWVGMSGGSATPGGSDTSIQFNDGGSAFGGTSYFTFSKTTQLASIGATLNAVANYAVGLRLYNDQSTSLSTVLRRSSPAIELVGIANTGVVTGGRFNRFGIYVLGESQSYEANLRFMYSYDTGTAGFSTIFQINTLNGIGVGASDASFVNYFRSSSTQTANKSYILPTDYPTASGTSVLQSTTAGVMSWVPMSSGSASPSGQSDGDIQFKRGSSFGATSNLNYLEASSELKIDKFLFDGELPTTSSAALRITGTNASFTGNSNGTYLAINAVSGFTGALMDVKLNGTSKLELLTTAATFSVPLSVTDTTNSTSTTTGALIVSGGAGFGKTIKVSGEVGVHNGFDLRVYSSGNAGYFGLNYTGASSNKTYTWPQDTPGTGTSVLQSNTSGVLSWVPMTAGGSATKRHQLITLAAGYTPATGTTVDDAVYRLPFSPADGTTSLTWNIREAFIRTETPSAGITTVQIEYNTGTGVFDPPTGTIVSGVGLSVGGAGIAESISRNFSVASLDSGTKLRLRFGTIDSTHNDFLITLLLEEN